MTHLQGLSCTIHHEGKLSELSAPAEFFFVASMGSALPQRFQYAVLPSTPSQFRPLLIARRRSTHEPIFTSKALPRISESVVLPFSTHQMEVRFFPLLYTFSIFSFV